MSIVGKRNNFERQDLLRFAESSGLKKTPARRVIDDVVAAVSDWPNFAKQAGINQEDIERIGRTHRTRLGAQ